MATDGSLLGQKAVTLPSDTTANRPTAVQGMFSIDSCMQFVWRAVPSHSNESMDKARENQNKP
jgi:hypothetical protein